MRGRKEERRGREVREGVMEDTSASSEEESNENNPHRIKPIPL